MKMKLRMTAEQHRLLVAHLLPDDGAEAVAVALCGRRAGTDHHLLVVREVRCIPYDSCHRTEHGVTWPPTLVADMLEMAAEHDLAIVKLHSHPGGFDRFSEVDDRSDRHLFESVFGWTDTPSPHASLVMLPDGTLFGRAIRSNLSFVALDSITVVGHDIQMFSRDPAEDIPGFAERHAQLFGEGTTKLLGRLSIAVIGCSGTGSPVVEQLARLGVGHLVLVDDDRIEERNLNRIIGATRSDEENEALKVAVLKRSVEAMGLGTRVSTFSTTLQDPDALLAVAGCDLVVGCVDSLAGRNILEHINVHYLLPYFDVGVKLDARAGGNVDEVAGSVHYVRPDGADLMDRGVYDAQALASEDLWRADPEGYAEQLGRGYVRGVNVDRPAVISVNMFFASLVVLEILARIHPFRSSSNEECAVQRVSIVSGIWQQSEEPAPRPERLRNLGRGDRSPLLGMPALGPLLKLH